MSRRPSRHLPSNSLRALATLGLPFALLLAPACGGAVAYNLGGEPDAGSGSSSGSGGSSSGSSSGGAQDAGAPVLDAAPTVDAIAVVDAGVVDSAPPVEEPPPTTTGPTVLCPNNGNPMTCQAGEYCCVSGNAMQGNQTDSCLSKSASCVGTPIRCAATADCPAGQVCCGSRTTTGYTKVACAATCAGNDITFCDPMASDCPQATPTCNPSQLLPGFNVCQ